MTNKTLIEIEKGKRGTNKKVAIQQDGEQNRKTVKQIGGQKEQVRNKHWNISVGMH